MVYAKFPAGVTVVLSLVNPTGTVSEGNGAMLVQVELQGYLETEVSVTVVTDDGTGTKHPHTVFVEIFQLWPTTLFSFIQLLQVVTMCQ